MVNHVLFALVRPQNDRPPLPHHERYGTAASGAKRTLANAAMSEKCHEQAPQQLPALFDHLVGAQQERFRYREAERLGGFEIHD
jgi:hypothetical protein